LFIHTGSSTDAVSDDDDQEAVGDDDHDPGEDDDEDSFIAHVRIYVICQQLG